MGSSLTPDLLALVEAVDNARANTRKSAWKAAFDRLTPIEQAREILRALNDLGWFVVDRKTVDDARKGRIIVRPLSEEHPIPEVEVNPGPVVDQALREQAEREEPFA